MAHFCSIFLILGAHTTSYGFLKPYRNLEKTSDTIARKCPDRQKDRQNDGQTLLFRALAATTEDPIISTKVLPKNNRNTLILEKLKMLQNKLN